MSEHEDMSDPLAKEFARQIYQATGAIEAMLSSVIADRDAAERKIDAVRELCGTRIAGDAAEAVLGVLDGT